MSEVKISSEASDSLLYALGVSFSESRGVKSPDADLVKWNGGTCLALHESAMRVIITASRPKA